MLRDLGWLKKVKIQNSEGTVINPATNEKAEEIKALLQQIESNTDELELKAETINLNTDDLETKLQSIDDKVGEVQSSPTQYTVLSRLKDIWDKLHDLFVNGVAKLKIWDGSTDLNIYPNGHIGTRLYDDHNKEAQLSAFGLLKIANETIIKDYRFLASTISSDFDIDITGSGSYNISDNITGLLLYSGASSSSSIKLTSIETHYYQSGRGRLIKFSVILGDTGINGNIREWGYYDDNDGIFFRMDGTTLKFVVRYNGVDTEYDSTSWDIPVTPDQYGHLYYIQFEWLGVGNVYLYYDEKIVHTYNFLGTSSNFSFRNPDLPVRFQNINTSNTSNVLLKLGCSSVVAEGGTIISGLNGNGTMQEVSVSPDGRLNVQIPIVPTNKTIQLVFDRGHSAVNKYEWQDVLEYTVPNGYDLNTVSFEASSLVAGENARVITRKSLATFDCPTDTFTDGQFTSLPLFASRMYLYVTSAIGSGSDDTITVTYTNSLGVTGRISTLIVPKNSLIGTRLELPLASGDYGILDVTNITHSATGQAGTFVVFGITELFYLVLTSSGVQYQASAVSLGGAVVLEAEKLYLQYKAESTVSNSRRLSLIGTLVEK